METSLWFYISLGRSSQELGQGTGQRYEVNPARTHARCFRRLHDGKKGFIRELIEQKWEERPANF